MSLSRTGRKSGKGLNPDASAAVASARKGDCRDAMKYLYDAAPHNQVACDSPDYGSVRNDFRQASIIVSGLCVRPNARKTSARHGGGTYDFQGAGRKRRRRRR